MPYVTPVESPENAMVNDMVLVTQRSETTSLNDVPVTGSRPSAVPPRDSYMRGLEFHPASALDRRLGLRVDRDGVPEKHQRSS